MNETTLKCNGCGISVTLIGEAHNVEARCDDCGYRMVPPDD